MTSVRPSESAVAEPSANTIPMVATAPTYNRFIDTPLRVSSACVPGQGPLSPGARQCVFGARRARWLAPRGRARRPEPSNDCADWHADPGCHGESIACGFTQRGVRDLAAR